MALRTHRHKAIDSTKRCYNLGQSTLSGWYKVIEVNVNVVNMILTSLFPTLTYLSHATLALFSHDRTYDTSLCYTFWLVTYTLWLILASSLLLSITSLPLPIRCYCSLCSYDHLTTPALSSTLYFTSILTLALLFLYSHYCSFSVPIVPSFLLSVRVYKDW